MNPLSPRMAAILRGCGSLLAPGGSRGTLLLLIFHRVLPVTDPLLPGEPDAATFAAQIDIIRATCSVLPLADAVDRLYGGSLPPRATCITFDDGYANNLTCAAPILASRGVPATIFVATAFLGGGRMWNDTVIESIRRAPDAIDLSAVGLGRFELDSVAARRRAIEAIIGALKYREPEVRESMVLRLAETVNQELPTDLMLTEAQVAALSRHGLSVGAHTATHPILTRVDAEMARREIVESKGTLEAVTGSRVTLFAYPNGRPRRDYDRAHVEMVREAGFAAAVSTSWGVCRRTSDRFQLPRMLPWERSGLRFAGRLLYTHREGPEQVA